MQFSAQTEALILGLDNGRYDPDQLRIIADSLLDQNEELWSTTFRYMADEYNIRPLRRPRPDGGWEWWWQLRCLGFPRKHYEVDQWFASELRHLNNLMFRVPVANVAWSFETRSAAFIAMALAMVRVALHNQTEERRER